MTTASKLDASNGSASASPSRNAIAGCRRVASAIIAAEKSRPTTSAPRAAAAAAIGPRTGRDVEDAAARRHPGRVEQRTGGLRGQRAERIVVVR